MSVSHSSFIMEKVFFLTAEHYLSSHRETGGLYSESYDNVAVLFASIPDFMDSFKDGGTDLSAGMLCLKALNEIIRNFDMVKANYSKYSRVPNKRPGRKFLFKKGTIFGQVITKGENFFTKYKSRFEGAPRARSQHG